MSSLLDSLTIEFWGTDHPLWNELLRLANNLGQTEWFDFRAAWHQSEMVFVALIDEQPVGFLRYVIQAIGSEESREPLVLRGEPLLEAKVLSFGVADQYRRQGIGRALQSTAIRSAMECGCYQMRSYSGGDYSINQHLKLSLGFAVQPVNRGEDKRGAYFILPLQVNWQN